MAIRKYKLARQISFFYSAPDLWWKEKAALVGTIQDLGPHGEFRKIKPRGADGEQWLAPFNKFVSLDWIHLVTCKSFHSDSLWNYLCWESCRRKCEECVQSWNGYCNTEWHFIFLAQEWYLVILSYHIAPCNGRGSQDDKIPATNSEAYSAHLFLGIQVAISSYTISRGNNMTDQQFSGGT